MKYSLPSLVFLFLLLTACGKKEEAPVKETIRPVRYEKIIKTGLGSTSTFSGVCQSKKETKMSFKVAGKISKLNVEIGDQIRRGQTIAIIDAVDYSITYEQANDQLKAAKTQVSATETAMIANKSNYQRVEKLYENNSVPLSEFEQAKAAYETSKSQHDAAIAQVGTAQSQVKAAKNQVVYTKLKAPFSGIITAVNVEENELVGSGSTVAVLSATSNPEVEVGLPESVITQITKGQKVRIHFSSLPNRNFEGVVHEVAYSSNDASTYPVTIKIKKPSSKIRPGMAVSVTFSSEDGLKTKPVLVAPAKAIGKGNDGNFAFVVQKNGDAYSVKKTKVEIGELSEKGFEIKNGLSEGDMVATAGLSSLLDGLKVRLME